MKLWLVGKHRVLLGDSTKRDHVESVMLGDRADMLFTSPPYLNARDYNKKIEDWDSLMIGAFRYLRMVDDAQLFVNLGVIHRKGEWFPYWDNWISQLRKWGWKRFAINIWHKKNPIPSPGMGRLTLSFEFVFQFNKKLRKVNKIIPCKNPGRKQSPGNVKMVKKDGSQVKFNHAGKTVQDFKENHNVVSTIKQTASYKATGISHPAMFPVVFPDIFIRSFTNPGEIIYDPFLGSGTTIIAAHRSGRIGCGIEISEEYVEMALDRIQKETGIEPVQVI